MVGSPHPLSSLNCRCATPASSQEQPRQLEIPGNRRRCAGIRPRCSAYCQNLSTGPDTKEEATAQDRNSSSRTTRKPADVPKPSTPPQEPATHSHVASTAPYTDEPPPAAKDIAIEAADKVSLWNKNEVWVMDNRATAIEYSFDQEQWTPVANLVKTVAACSGKINNARIGDLTATVYVRYTDGTKLSPVYKIPVASVEAHSPPKGLGQPASPPRQIRPIAPVPSTHPATSAAPATKEKSADSSSGSMGRETLQDRLRGTTWRNTNGVIFRWTQGGHFTATEDKSNMKSLTTCESEYVMKTTTSTPLFSTRTSITLSNSVRRDRTRNHCLPAHAYVRRPISMFRTSVSTP